MFMKKGEAITIEMITIKRRFEERSGRRDGHRSAVGAVGKPRGQARPFNLDAHISPTNPSVCNKFSKRAEELAEHLKLSNSVCNSVKGKLSLGAKIVKKGGVENLFRQIFSVDDPEEKLLKTYVCYLCTTTDPVAGVMFISTQRFAFCSERPLLFTSPSGGFGRSYYRVVMLVKDLTSVNSHENVEKPSEKYIEIQAVGMNEFVWLTGFLNFDKAFKYMQQVAEYYQLRVVIESI